MAKSVEIEKIQRKGPNYILSISTGDSFPVPREIRDKYSLKPGMNIAEDRLLIIRHEGDLKRAENYVLYLLSRRSYTFGHLAIKLNEKGFDKILINGLLNHLKERGLIDDNAFARQMADSIMRHKPAGRNYLIAQLRRKYVPRSIAESVVDDILEGVDQVQIAHDLLHRRWAYFSKFDLETARRKAYNYLSRRSIGYHAAREAFEKIIKEDG